MKKSKSSKSESANVTDGRREQEDKYFLAAIVESSKDSIISVNFESIITSWNKGAESLYGYTAAEAIGKPLTMLTLPEDFTEVFANIDKIRQSRKVETFETERKGKDGHHMTLEVTLSPVKNAEGEVIGVSTIARDVTDRKQQAELRELNARIERRAQVFDTTLSAITDFAYIFDRDGRFIYANQPLLDLLGINLEEITGRNFYELPYPKDLADKLQKQIERVIETKKVVVDETPFTSPAGVAGFYEYIFSPVFAADGTVEVVAGSTRDITGRRRAEEALRESEERLRLLVESASDYAIFTMTPEGRINYWNAGAENVFGWSESEALGQTGEIIFTPEDRAKGEPKKEIETALKNGRAPDERFHLCKDGSRFYASGVVTPLQDADGNIQGFAKIARDITERLEAEKALREKEMLQRIVGAQEDERKRIARDLHDELGQQLTALRLKLAALRKLCETDKLCGRIDEIQLIARSIDNGVDFLTWELRPAALDDLGLVAALDNYVRQWSHHSGVTAELLASSLKRARFAPETETNLYRIVQEALNNTNKHAKAKSAEVMLKKRGDLIVLIIEDDGTGFHPKNKKNRLKGIGLIGMEERAALIGGTLEIESAPGQGTTIFVRAPAPPLKRRASNGK